MNHSFIISILLFISLLCPVKGGASVMFHHYGVESGLSQSTAYTILQDRVGFIWIGTKSGLNRFDGTSFKVYRASKQQGCLGRDYVTVLYEDVNGDIWVGTDAGVWIYHPQTNTFSRFDVHSSNGTMVTGYVNVIKGLGSKIYIAANEQGVFCYDLHSKAMTNHCLPKLPNVSGMGFARNGRLWLGLYGGGLYNADHALRQLIPFKTNDGKIPFAGDVVSSIVEMPNGKLFVGSEKHGLSEIDLRNKSLTSIVDKYNGKDIFVRAITVRKGIVLAATEMGLYVFNTRNNELQHFMYQPYDAFSLSDNPLYSIYIDRDDALWTGSYFGGVNYLPPANIPFNRILPQGEDGGALPGRRVREMVQDKYGMIWIGTEDAGLCKLNPTTNEITTIPASSTFPNVHGLYADGDYLWVGTFSYGLKVIDIRTGQVVKSFMPGDKSGDLRTSTIFCIDKSPSGRMFFGTIKGLCCLAPDGKHFNYVLGVPQVLINDIHFDSKGNFWVSTQTQGIYLLRKGNSHWTHFNVNGSGLTSEQVLSIYEDSEGCLWFTTQGGGVCRYNALKNKIEPFTVGEDNIGSTVFKVLEDRQGTFWFTTYDGLVRYTPSTKSVRHYSNSNLLLDNQFNNKSALLSSDGMVYFGSLNGIVSFNPANFKRPYRSHKLVASQLWIDGEEVSSINSCNIVYAKSITLTHEQRSFSIRVVPMYYASMSPTDLEYKLEGFDKEWQPMRADCIIAYSNLSSGHYKLMVRLRGDDGKWETSQLTLEVTVKPHPLLSIWAKIAYVLIFLFIIWRIWKRSKEHIALRRRRALETFEHEKEQELYESKIHFFTNVAHEIRTPLSLIKMPLESIIDSGEVKDKEVMEDLIVMRQNTDRLTDLINQLLDFRKAERDGVKLNFERYNINKIVKGVYDWFVSVMQEKNIDAQLSIKADVNAQVDREGFTKMVSNLMNNAVKYCASKIVVVLNTDNNNFYVEVSNDGNIVPDDMREKIFQPFVRMDDAQTRTGTGIGLALVRSLAELHNGTVKMMANSTMNVFRLTLPLDQTVEPQDTDKTLNQEIKVVEPEYIQANDKKYTLLIVEDNEQMRQYESRKLSNDYNILTASDGEDALEVLSKNMVSLIVSDIMMEPMGGLELLKRVKQDNRFSFIPVILLTAVTSDAAKMAGMENGADEYIVKPFSMDYLADTIANLLRQREEVKRAYATSPLISSETVSISTTNADFLRKLKDAVMRNIDNSEFNVDKLAAELNMSRTSLNRKIRGTLDVSPNNYIRIERLKAAAQMLKNGDAKVNEVCYSVGFTSPSYFTKCFYNLFGLLPKEFAKQGEEEK